MDMRDMRRLPPRNSRGEFRRRRSRRGDRAMEDMRMGGYGDYAQNQMANRDMRGNYRGNDMGDMARGYDRAGQDYGYDGHHHPQGQGSTYYPIQAMGTFEGYYGMPEQDYGYDMRYDMPRGGRGRMGGRGRDYGYDMRGGYGRDYGYDYGDYGDYGETLTEEELDKWNKKLLAQLDEREKQMFSKEMFTQKAKAMGKPMEGFGEKELYTTALMLLTDYKMSLPANPDTYMRLAYDWLSDKDVAVKGAEKLAVYYDCIVEGEDD